eukprot:Seg1289.13 transcript_id=Seg1289.13/GoldUCD/mRNA.D3Y31 product="hypothetical protein" protein_id=Seg1289.13/GoldUCD/D3Y31
MEQNMAETVATKMKTENMTMKKPQGDVSFGQKKNHKLIGDVRKWKDRALKAEEKLKQEKRAHDGHITKLGFKMLQFENELRKEQREIEQRFLEKDQQIRILEDVIGSLHEKMKTNTLCYNCFMTKHNATHSELSPGPESFVAKFPLDLDFNDRKSPTHDGKARSMSLPLNFHSAHESPKSSAEFCFHHLLSPVPEELENSFLEHAKKVNHQSIIEEEDENGDQESEGDREEGTINCGPAATNENKVPVFNPRQDEILQKENANTDQISLAETNMGENLSECRDEESKSNNELCALVADVSSKADETSEKTILDGIQPHEELTNLDDKKIDTGARLQEQEIGPHESENSAQDESVSACLKEDTNEVQSETRPATVGSDEIICANVQLIIDKVVDTVIESNIFKENTETDSSNEVDKEVTPAFSYDANNIEITAEQENGNKKPLSPKSEMIVAELKKAIFEASLKVEDGADQNEGNNESNMDIKDETTNTGNETSDAETKPHDDKEQVLDPGQNTNAILIEDIDLNFAVDGQKTKGEDSDSLTDYDVIELD